MYLVFGKTICDERSIKQELTHLNSVLSENGFLKDKIHLQPPTAHTTRNTDSEEYTNAVCIRYTGPTSHKIERILRRANIKEYHSPQMNMHGLLFSLKDKYINVSKPCVYRIPCECGEVYIGEAGRNLTTRQKEHLDCGRKGQVEKSSVAKHVWEKDHSILWNDCTLFAPVRNYYSRKVRESIEILKHVTIQQEEKPLSDIWSTLFGR